MGGERYPEALIAQGGDDALARLTRGVLHEAGEIGDALGGCESSDGPHRLLAVRRVNPGADCMRHDQAGEQDEHGLSEQALREKARHCWLTAGVNM